MLPMVLVCFPAAVQVHWQEWQPEHHVGMPVAALSRGADKNPCNSTKSRLRRAWSSFAERGSPVSHTNVGGGCTPMVGANPGVTSEASRDVAFCGLAA